MPLLEYRRNCDTLFRCKGQVFLTFNAHKKSAQTQLTIFVSYFVNIRLTYRPYNRAENEISPLNLDAPRRETYGGNQPNYDNRISSNYNLYN